MSTSQIAYGLAERLSHTRDQLIRMHHLGMIEPIGVRNEGELRASVGYFQDIVWTLTLHTKEHHHHHPQCRGCKVREIFRAGAEALLE